MRKFTKEIAALLAAVSVSTSANMAMTNTETTNAASNAAAQNQPSFTTTAGAVAATTRVGTEVATTATTTKVTTRVAAVPGSTLPPDEGVQMIPDEYTTTSTTVTTTTIGTQTSKLTTTTRPTTTTTTIGTQIATTPITTAIPSNDRIELPLEDIEIGGGKFTDDNIYGEYAAFYAQGARDIVLHYSVDGDCDEIEGVFMTAVDGMLVEERFTAAVENGIAKVVYHVPYNSNDYITAVVFNPEEKGIALEKVELVNLESGRTTTLPPLAGTIIATQPVSTTPAISTTPAMSPGEDIELNTEDLNVGTETDDKGETYNYFEFDPNNADFITFRFVKEGDTTPFTFKLIIPTPYDPVVIEYPEYISGGELEMGITVPAYYHGGIIRAEYYDSSVVIDEVILSKFEDSNTTTTTVPPLAGVTTSTRPRQTDIPPLMGTQTIPTSTTTQTYIAGGMMPSDEETTTTTTTIPPLEGTQVPTTEPETFPPLMGVMPIHIYGDANNDSAVSIADAAAILQYIANPDKYGLSENGMIAADVVGNGNGITVDDAIAIQKLDAKLIDDFSEFE